MIFSKMAKRRLGLTAAMGAVLLTTGCAASAGAPSGGAAGAQAVTVTGSTGYPQTHPMGIALEEWGESVTDASGGDITFEWYHGDSLVGLADNATALADGLTDVGYVVPMYTPAEFPADAWASLIGHGLDERPVVGLLAAAAATIEFGFTEPALSEELESAGIVPLVPRFQNWDNYNLLCTSPVTSLADAQGKRVRVGGDAYARVATALGMTPVSLTASEQYEAMERGVVDCFIGGEGDMTGQGLWEVASEWTQIGLPGWNSIALGLGQGFTEELGEENLSVMKESLGDFVNRYYTNYLLEQHEFFRTGADAYGIEYHQPDADLEAAIEEYYTGLREEMPEDAPAAFEDPEATLDRYDELLAKWTEIVIDLGYDPGTTDRVAWAAESGEELDIDLSAWSDRVQSELFDVYVD